MSFPSHWQLQTAARWIRAGGVIAYPTEAVFGLGCNPADHSAVARLLTLKDRSWRKGLILIAAEQQQLEPWIQPISENYAAQLNSTWPGPTTWLLPASGKCPDWLTGGHSTLAVRVTAHPLARRLCTTLNSPIVSTSANIHGRAPARSVLEVRLQFGTRVDFVLPGQLGKQDRPTEIRDLVSGKFIRE